MINSVRVLFLLISTLAVSAKAQQAVTYMNIHPQWSPDGSKIVYYRVPSDFSESWIQTINVSSGEVKTVVSGGYFNSNPVWHSSGTEILFASARPNMRSGEWQLYRQNMGTGERTQVTHSEGRKGHPSWHPDGNLVAYQKRVPSEDGSFKTDMFLMNIGTGRETRVTETEDNEFHPKFSAAGDQVFFDAGGRQAGRIFAYTLKTGETSLVIDVPEGMRAGVPALSPDGKMLAYAYGAAKPEDGAGNLAVTNLETGERRVLTELELGQNAGGPTWSPDGKRIAFHISKGRTATLWIIDVDSGKIEKLGLGQ